MHFFTFTKKLFLLAIVLAGMPGFQELNAKGPQHKDQSTVENSFTFISGSAISVNENTTVVTMVQTSGGVMPVTYKIGRGADKALFAIDDVSGNLTFIKGADYELPADSNGDNVYEVAVTAVDSARNRIKQDLYITIVDIDETPIVEEPIIEEPVTEEPVVEEPVIEEPVVEEPVVIEEPIAEEPVVVEEPVIEESAPVCVEGPATHSGQVTDSVSALGMAGVEVSIGGCETTTDAEGYYTLSNIAATERAVVNFDHDGYFKSSVLIQVDHYSEGTTNVSLNYLEHTIDAYDNQWSYDSQSEISGAHVDVPAGSLSDAAGNAYTGTVNAGLEYFDIVTDADKKLFPGAFEGQNVNGETVLFSSYGLVSLSLSDINGNALNLAEGATATLTFDAVASLPEQNIIPLWYYDYTQGLWIEEGYAELQADGTYKGEVSHLGTWSVNMPLETAPGTYRGRIVYSDGISVKDARVAAIGPNWVRSDLSTDADGNFEIEVLPDDNFKLVAYNYKWKYEAAYSGTIAAVASGDIVE